MRVLVTGGEGQLGRALQASAPQEAVLTALSRSDCDIRDEISIHRVFDDLKPDLVFNAAAYSAVNHAEIDEDNARAINATAVDHLARAAAARGARLVHVSTDYVFDGESGHPYGTADETNPLSAYGRTKREGEVLALAGDPRCLLVRTAWLYAATGSNFVLTILGHMQARGTVSVVADQIGTPTHAPSLARALWDLALAGGSGIHHFTDSGIASWYDFAVAIAEEAKAVGLLQSDAEVIPIATADYPSPAQRPAMAVLDKFECWQALGWVPAHWRVNLRTMLREVADHG